MHVIHFLDADGGVVSEFSAQSRDRAFRLYDQACQTADPEIVAEVTMSEGGRVHRRHRIERDDLPVKGIAPVAFEDSRLFVETKEQADAETDAPAAEGRVRERAADGPAAEERDEPAHKAEPDRAPARRAAKAADTKRKQRA